MVILGPTATGKTDLALDLAQKYQGELVSCDSRQVYKGLDIGTGKLPGGKVTVRKGDGFWEINGVKVWMYDVADPRKRYTVKDYILGANAVVKDILKRGKLPIVVGGTGLYLRALLEGLPDLAVPVDEKLRKELEALSLEELQKRLISISPQAFKNLNESDRKNKRRLLRAIELLIMYPYKDTRPKITGLSQRYNVLKIGLSLPRQVLNKKIDYRAQLWLEENIVGEVKKLVEEGVSLQRFRGLGLEYGVVADLIAGKVETGELLKKMQVKVRQYAKRQVTWFKKEKNVHWFDINGKDWNGEVAKLVAFWYHSSDGQKD